MKAYLKNMLRRQTCDSLQTPSQTVKLLTPCSILKGQLSQGVLHKISSIPVLIIKVIIYVKFTFSTQINYQLWILQDILNILMT